MTADVTDLMKKLVSLCKRRGYVFQSGEIYGGLQSSWDYGPLGIELKKNIENNWWNFMVTTRPDIVGMDSAIITHPDVWKASGHLKNFHDPMVDCMKCKSRFRLDHIKGDTCPECGGPLTEPRDFGLMFKTQMGALEDDSSTVYLRPETCQPIFVNFRNIVNATRLKLPFGIAQMGKAFRNEITARNFIFRSREFEQMEMEFFCLPEEADKWFEFWLGERMKWYYGLGIKSGNLRTRRHDDSELAHYASSCFDIEYTFPFATNGWGELEGVANRTDFDMKAHIEGSGQDLSYHDQVNNTKTVPYVIESSGGIGRTILAVLLDAYREEEVEGRERIVLSLHRSLAPIKAAVLPLSKKLSENAMEVFDMLRPLFPVTYDVTGSIGKRYRRMDEAGTPFCITYDFDSLDDKMVTIRERDSLGQIRIPIENLSDKLKDLMDNGWPEEGA
jgi:glycyl-tRNA synthetase